MYVIGCTFAFSFRVAAKMLISTQKAIIQWLGTFTFKGKPVHFLWGGLVTPKGAQELQLALCSVVTSGDSQGSQGLKHGQLHTKECS